MKKITVALTATLGVASALATDMYWCGGGTSSNPTHWNNDGLFWKIDNTGDAVSWSSGADPKTAYFTSASYFGICKGASTMSWIVDSSETVGFNGSLAHTWSTSVLGKLQSIVKKGTGTFQLNDGGNIGNDTWGMANRSDCVFDVQGGTLYLYFTTKASNPMADYARRLVGNTLVRVGPDATYKVSALAGLGEKDANQPSIELNGGTWTSAGSESHVDYVKDLHYNGGTVNIADSAVPTIMGKLSVTGTTARTLSVTTTGDTKYLQLNPGPGQTEIYVDNVTGDSAADLTFPEQSSVARVVSANGFVKTGTGTLQYNKKWSSGDITGVCEVRGGTMRLIDKSAKSYQGSMDCAAYSFLVNTNATLTVPYRNIISPGWSIWHDQYAKVVYRVYGGSLIIGDDPADLYGTHYFGEELLLDDANFACNLQGASNEANGLGAIVLPKKMILRGKTAYDFSPADEKYESKAAYNLYPDCQGGTTLTVDDITQSSAVDATFNVRLRDYFSSSNSNTKASTPNCMLAAGITKKGAGTVRLANAKNSFTGALKVDEGTLWTDGPATSAIVAAGACLGGTGTVASVTLAEGAGFSVRDKQTQPLCVASAVALPASGFVDIVSSGELPERVKVPVLKSAAGVTGDLAGWTVRVNGQADRRCSVTLRDGTLYVRRVRGLLAIIR